MKYCEAYNHFQICARRRSRRKCPEWPFVPPKLSWSLDHFESTPVRWSKWGRSWGKKRRRSAKWPSGVTSLDHFVEQNHHFARISSNSNLSGTQTRRNERAHNLKTHLTTSQLVTNLQAYAESKKKNWDAAAASFVQPPYLRLARADKKCLPTSHSNSTYLPTYLPSYLP